MGHIYGRTDENRDRWEHQDDPYASRQRGVSGIAFDIGYRDGVTSGQYDRGRHRHSHYEDADAYRRADHGYAGGSGDREAHQAG